MICVPVFSGVGFVLSLSYDRRERDGAGTEGRRGERDAETEGGTAEGNCFFFFRLPRERGWRKGGLEGEIERDEEGTGGERQIHREREGRGRGREGEGGGRGRERERGWRKGGLEGERERDEEGTGERERAREGVTNGEGEREGGGERERERGRREGGGKERELGIERERERERERAGRGRRPLVLINETQGPVDEAVGLIQNGVLTYDSRLISI